jgi:NAD+ diphosphatase
MPRCCIAYHTLAGDIRLSPELCEYRLFTPQSVRSCPAGTGCVVADWLTLRGHVPHFMALPLRPA